MSAPAPFDLVAGLLVLVLVIYGVVKGLARLVLTVCGLAAGWYLALRWCGPVGEWLGARSPDAGVPGPDLHRMAAFGLIGAGVFAAAALAGWLITKALGKARLGGLNRLAGAGAGLLASIVLACAATIPLVALWPPDGGPPLRSSVLAPFAVAGGSYLTALAPRPLRERFDRASRGLMEGATTGPKREPAPRRR